MTTTKLKNTVTAAVELDREIREKQAELETLEDLLKHEAETNPDDHTATELGGWSWVTEGNDGCIVRVTQEGPKLKSSISTDKDIQKAKNICGPLFINLFEPRITYRLTAGFRERATLLLGATSARLTRALTSKGSRKVSYETKQQP